MVLVPFQATPLWVLTAVSQGYMASGTGTSGNNGNTTCANDTTPCAPTTASNSTVGAGTNLQNYCTSLLGSNQSMIVNAGSACRYGTTDACTYDPDLVPFHVQSESPIIRQEMALEIGTQVDMNTRRRR